MISEALFFVFAGLAIACALSTVYHRNPLYSAISLIGVFLSLSCIYVTLAAPFIAAVQVLIYAGAIMVLVIFVIMLLNLEDDKPLARLKYLNAVGAGLGLILLVQTFFVFYAVMRAPNRDVDETQTVGKTLSIGAAMYTEYLLPVEIVGILLLMAIIGSVILVRRFNQTQIERMVEEELTRRHEEDEIGDFRISL
ncbi:MAG: NADH-quinone oxidoreductase subunit J [Pyrinomonadaceae bacterium]